MNKRAIVFIDGFNLYYGLSTFGDKYKWLNIQDLAQGFIQRDDTELTKVLFFTAIVKGAADKSARQKVYLDTLSHHCNLVEVRYGHFLLKDKRCRHCGTLSQIAEEKKTDVNLACALLQGAYENQYDIAYVVSGDSDLVPPVEIVRQLGKTVIVAHPPKRKSDELCKTANNWFSISENALRKHQFPKQVGHHVKPIAWG